LSLFWLIEADITSMLAVVSSTLAACSLAAWLRDWAVALTWLAAPVRHPRHSMMPASLSQLSIGILFDTVIERTACRGVMRCVKSPLADLKNTRPTSSMMLANFSVVALASVLSCPKVPA
jgi:hypothetical protein